MRAPMSRPHRFLAQSLLAGPCRLGSVTAMAPIPPTHGSHPCDPEAAPARARPQRRAGMRSAGRVVGHLARAYRARRSPRARVEADGPRTILAKARDDAQQPITLHEARHTCASLLIAAGVNAKALSVIIGHATIAMTFDVYGKLMPGGLEGGGCRERLSGRRPEASGAQARGVKARASLGPVVY